MSSSVAVDDSLQEETVSERVISKVAERTGTDPLELRPLYEVVDPEALDRFFETGRARADGPENRVQFTYSGCDVEISGDGTVRVSTTDE